MGSSGQPDTTPSPKARVFGRRLTAGVVHTPRIVDP